MNTRVTEGEEKERNSNYFQLGTNMQKERTKKKIEHASSADLIFLFM